VRAPRSAVLSVVLAVAGTLGTRPTGAEVQAAPASPPRYTPYVDRGNALPAPYAYGQPGIAATLQPGKPALIEGSLGFGVGLTSHVFVDGSVGTLAMAPGVGFHSLQIGPNLLLVDTPPFELVATTHVSLFANDGRPVEQIEPGLLAVVRSAHQLRLDAGLYVDANPGPTPTFGLRVPLSVAFQLSSHVYAAVTTGVTVGSFADNAGTTAIPAGLTLGWGDRFGEGPHRVGVAVVPSIVFPALLTPGAPEPFRPDTAVMGLALVVVSRLW
jgi:hypothetical protein